jgi:hypothetical protein
MRNLITALLLTILFLSCEKGDFSLQYPDVEKFIRQLKNANYSKYEYNETGEKLWTKMPSFTKEHLPLLIKYSRDTSLITPCEHFPLNPVSSIPPYRSVEGKSFIMLGEYLLWIAESILEDKPFASLTPTLKNHNYREDQRLNGEEILEVREIYQNWWDKYGETDTKDIYPLKGTAYYWR